MPVGHCRTWAAASHPGPNESGSPAWSMWVMPTRSGAPCGSPVGQVRVGRPRTHPGVPSVPRTTILPVTRTHPPGTRVCLLYTSDAADDLLCVDLGGRRII